MPSWGFGLTYGDDDEKLIDQLADELEISRQTFHFPSDTRKAKAILEKDDKLTNKLDALARSHEVTRFALLLAAGMQVGADITVEHRKTLDSWLESSICGDLHVDGQTVLLRAVKIYENGRPLDIVGQGQQVLLIHGREEPGAPLPEFYSFDHQGVGRQIATDSAYPAPPTLPPGQKMVGFGTWGSACFQSDLELDVLADIGGSLRIEDLYNAASEMSDEARQELNKHNKLNRKLAKLLNGEGLSPQAVVNRKRNPAEYCFAIMMTAGMSVGAKIDKEHIDRLKGYLESEKCELGSQARDDLRQAVKVYKSGTALPLVGEGLRSVLARRQREISPLETMMAALRAARLDG